MKTQRTLPTAVAGLVVALSQALAEPTLMTQPTDVAVSLNATAQFRAAARSSGGTVAYRWWFKDAAVDPALNPSAGRATLSISNVTEAMAGQYSVVVTDANGSVTSRLAQLTVDPTFRKITEGPVVTDRESSIAASACDYDNDGQTDLLVLNYWWPNPQRVSLYHNEGSGGFSKVTNAITTAANLQADAVWADCDNDGDPDLFMSHVDRTNSLYRNDGGGVFVPVNNALTSVRHRYFGAAWADLEGDGWVDLFVGTVVASGSTFVGHTNDFLFRNTGTDFVALGADAAGDAVTDAMSCTVPSWCDFDNDGDLDLYVGTRQTSASLLYRNNGQGRFERVKLGSVPGGASEGACWADVNNDGFFDAYVFGYSGAVQTLHLNRAGSLFEDVTAAAGLTPGGAAWGPAFGDYDNDGDLDLFVPDYESTNALYSNNGDGTFTRLDVGSPITEGFRDEGAVWMDYDNDGFLDLFVACGEAEPAVNLLYHNNLPATGNNNHWLKVKLVGTASNRQGIGAKVRVRSVIRGREVWQVRAVTSNSLFAGGADFIAHFGLGDATVADVVRVEWPSGNVQELTGPSVDRILTITEPGRIQPPRPTGSLGASVVLSSQPSGIYQWRFNGVDLAGETQRSLRLSNLQAAQHGRYSVVVTATDSTLTTNFAYLIVDPTFSKIMDGPIVTPHESGWSCNWLDFDDDGNLDLFVPNGAEAPTAERSALFKGDGHGGFTRLPASEGGALVTDLGQWTTAACGDYNNDGSCDVIVTSWNAGDLIELYQNRGASGFSRVLEPTSFGPGYGTPMWVDYDLDGWLDLYIASGWSQSPASKPYLWHNESGTTFARVTATPPVTDAFSDTEAATWADYDGDGDPDLLVADMLLRRMFLYRNQGRGELVRATAGALTTDRASFLVPSVADYDNDGWLDVLVSCYSEPTRLYRNTGEAQFTSELSIRGAQLGRPAWGDYDNDGHLDFYLPQGQGDALTNQFWRNNGDGTFTPLRTGSLVSDKGRSPAAAWGDYDNDGFLDLFVPGNKVETDQLYHNNGNSNSWLVVKLVGTTANRSAIGAKVRVRAVIAGKPAWQMRELSGGNRVQDDPRAHFGLGHATKASVVRIEWPSGTVQELADVSANQILTVTEPPRLESLGQGRLRILCWARQNYELEASNDLDTWTSLGVVATDVNRPEVIDPGAASHPYRFYRAVKR